MKKVNLDEEYEIFKEKFLEIHNFEQEWRNYQNENGLIDQSNEINF